MEENGYAYKIRNMNSKDVNHIINFEVDEFTIIYPDKIYLRHVKHFPKFSLVLEINDNVQGFIIGSSSIYEGLLYSHITSIFINEEFRGKGFGSKLMYEFEEISKLLKCKFVNLFVNDRNTCAIEFYKGRDYYVYQKISKYYNNTEDALEMRKNLV